MKVPRDLLDEYRRAPEHRRDPNEYRREIIIALGADFEEAKLAAEGQSLLMNLEFKEKRERLYRTELASAGVKRANATDVRRAVAEAKRRRPMKDVKLVTRAIADTIRLSLVRRMLDDDLTNRIDPERRVFAELAIEKRAESIALWEECVRSGKTEPYHDAAVAEADLHHYRIAPDAEGIPLLTYQYVQGQLEAAKYLALRDRGEVVDSEAIAPISRTALRERRKSGTEFGELLKLWAEKERRPQKTIDAYRADLKRFEAFLYERDKLFVEDVTNEDWLGYADHLQATQHIKTLMRKLGSVQTIFNYAFEKRKLPGGNPCSRIKINAPKNAKKPRLPFNLKELQAIFGSPVYCDGWRPRGRGGEAFFWLPLLALFSGAREEELGQIRTADIDRVGKLGWIIKITDEHPEQSLKNAASRRRAPLHPELVRCGFLKYVERQRRLGHAWLFEQLKPDKYGKRTSSYSKLFNRYLRVRLNITDRTRTFHSFRHSFKDACRDASIPKDVHDALTGHTRKDSGEGYGGEEYPIKPLFQELRKLRYPGLDLSHIHSG